MNDTDLKATLKATLTETVRNATIVDGKPFFYVVIDVDTLDIITFSSTIYVEDNSKRETTGIAAKFDPKNKTFTLTPTHIQAHALGTEKVTQIQDNFNHITTL